MPTESERLTSRGQSLCSAPCWITRLDAHPWLVLNYAAHGRFDAVARRSSFQFWLARHKDTVLATTAAVAAAAVALYWNGRAPSDAATISDRGNSDRITREIETAMMPPTRGAAEPLADPAHSSVDKRL